MILLFQIIFFLEILFNLSSYCFALKGVLSSTPSTPPVKQEALYKNQEILEREKINLEIKKLKNEVNSNNYVYWFQFGTLLAAFIAAGISFWSASKSQKYQIESITKSQISGLLKELGSEHLAVKTASIQALSEYEAATCFLINILKFETESRIIASTITALQRLSSNSFHLLIDETKYLHEQHLIIASKLVNLGMPKKEVEDMMLIDNKTFSEWINTNRYRRITDSISIEISTLCKINNITEDEAKLLEKPKIINDWRNLQISRDSILNVIERVIQAESKKSKYHVIKNAYLQGIILDALDLSGWRFENTDLRDSSFKNSNCNSSVFYKIDASNANFYEAKFNNAIFIESKLNRTNFIASDLTKVQFKNCNGSSIKFYGTLLHKASFSESKLVGSSFDKNSKCMGLVMKNCKLYGSNFIECICKNSKFWFCGFDGVNFTQVKVDYANFLYSTFSGTKFIQSKFNNTKFNNTTFESIQQFRDTTFRNTQWNHVKFIKETQEFQAYINCQLYENRISIINKFFMIIKSLTKKTNGKFKQQKPTRLFK
jgi:uncharacterized protein YjbI with pentapeptide repeats